MWTQEDVRKLGELFHAKKLKASAIARNSYFVGKSITPRQIRYKIHDLKWLHFEQKMWSSELTEKVRRLHVDDDKTPGEIFELLQKEHIKTDSERIAWKLASMGFTHVFNPEKKPDVKKLISNPSDGHN